MSEKPSRLVRAAAWCVLVFPVLVRLALVLTALGLLYHGARMVYEPAGYLVVGALLWFEVARRSPRAPGGGAEGGS